MKITLNHVLILFGFIISGVVTHFQLDKKVIQIEAMITNNTTKMELHVEKEINKLKDKLKILKVVRN